MLRGVLFKEVVLAQVLKPMHYLHPNIANYKCLFHDLCHLMNKDDEDDNDDEDEKSECYHTS